LFAIFYFGQFVENFIRLLTLFLKEAENIIHIRNRVIISLIFIIHLTKSKTQNRTLMVYYSVKLASVYYFID